MKCALVTGGSRGIGRAICLQMARMGYYVLVNFRSNVAAAEQTLREVRAVDGHGELLPFDVSDKGQVQDTLGVWIESNPDKTIEVLINNAGVLNDALMLYMTDEQWKEVVHGSLDGFFFVTRLVLQDMLFKRYGRIVNMVSLSGLKGVPGQANYSAAKAGLIGATRSLAQEVARHGITVNAVAPGFIRTDMTEGFDEEKLKDRIPVKRFGLPEEVAHAVGFLVSPEAAYITSEVLSVNGGLYP